MWIRYIAYIMMHNEEQRTINTVKNDKVRWPIW